ncbi:MAG TPA: hypothetical protein VEO94_00960 [Candidatus Dormibacteraeota bacterium]|nr:hypothetical protein [Candidatus Dormibacteraeota bacterium]
MQVATQHTEEQRAEFRRVFVVRRRRRRLVAASFLTLVVAVLVLRLRGVEEVFGVPSGRWGLYVFGYGVLSVLLSLVSWRCPACHRPLGRYGNPRFCFRCGAPLQ